MNDPLRTGSAVEKLRAHLPPELYARLRAKGDLPEAAVREQCARLRAELAAIVTYIPSPVVREQLARPEPGRIRGAYWEGSVLFADLSGFTALSERLSTLGKQGAEEISAIINNLFGALVEEVHRYCGDLSGGGLLKFGGDALTAFFDAAALGRRHAMLAVRAALAMQERMAAFSALSTRAGLFRLQLRIGVHSGRVFAAQVGDRDHIELVVTGRNINRVALAQEIAGPGEVVISRATLALLEDATVEQRRSDFYLLTHIPDLLAPHAPHYWAWEAGSGDLAELLALAERIDALRPYLPLGLPGRFLHAQEAGEFRPVTVLFANFFPFSNALALLGDDVEAAALALNAYFRRVQQVIHRYGGIVNKIDMYTYGDKLMALFGAPVAHEDDPERAVRAALALRDALAEANAEMARYLAPVAANLVAVGPHFIRQRIGINTGVVFAGPVGSARRREYTVMGQQVNLAARLMSVADEGGVVIAQSTRRAVEGRIAVRDRTPVYLKGVAEPVPCADALQPFETAREPRRGLARSALVNRTHELATLIDLARTALSGHGRVAALVGDAGAGKTRLVEEALQRMVMLSIEPGQGIPAFFPYSAECQSYEQSTPYAAMRDLLWQIFSLHLPSTDHERVVALSRRVSDLAPDLTRFTPLLSDVLGLPIEETSLTQALAPDQRRERAHDLIEALVLAEARSQPLVLIVDDLHWADASSLELLERLARRAPGAALLLLFGYRLEPRIAEPWADLPHCTRLPIRELTAAESAELLRTLLQDQPPPNLLAPLIEKAQGNPFFLGEVVRDLIESGVLVRDQSGWVLTRTLDEAAVPDSIEGVITARLDRLEEANRDVLQIASVIGRRFPYPVLSGVAVVHSDLHARLAWLADADLITADEPERDLAYLFKHALTRDVAYEAILYARRRELHRRVAEQIEHLYGTRLDDQLPVLAGHYLLAEDWERAFTYHLEAGRRAQARYANREAIALFERALQIVRRLQAGADLSGAPDLALQRTRVVLPIERVIEIEERLGVVYALIGQYDTALSWYTAALERLQAQGDAQPAELMRLHRHIARAYERRADFQMAFEWIERALALDEGSGNLEQVRCLLLGSGLHQRLGRNAQALEWGERALHLAEQVGSTREQADAYMLLGATYLNMGDNLHALELTTRCLELYAQTHDLVRLADAHNNLAIACQYLGRLAEAREHFEAGAELKQTIGDIYGEGMIACNLGELFRVQDRLDEAIDQYQHALAIYERIGSHYMLGVLHMNLGAVNLLRGDETTADRHLRRSAELFEQAGAEDFLPELERYLAELHLRRGRLAEARMACEISLSTAARLEARAEEGVTRRVLSQVLVRSGDLAGAWSELERSLAILRESASPHELARTLVAVAELAPALARWPAGQAALDEALPILRAIGAPRDLDAAYAAAQRYHYTIDHEPDP